MTKLTIAELQTQIAAAQLEIDKQMLEPILAVVEAFSDPAIQNAIDVAQANLELCTGEVRQQISNLLIVNQNSVQFLRNHADNLNLRLNGPLAATMPVSPLIEGQALEITDLDQA